MDLTHHAHVTLGSHVYPSAPSTFTPSTGSHENKQTVECINDDLGLDLSDPAAIQAKLQEQGVECTGVATVGKVRGYGRTYRTCTWHSTSSSRSLSLVPPACPDPPLNLQLPLIIRVRSDVVLCVGLLVTARACIWYLLL
jgi:hypothetical protein